jgi:peptidoglycan/LPS O-acetylase OafA/YrhL
VVRAEGRTIGYQPALDGVRAVAVALVLLFHLGLGWMSGGYLGVSVFFTLSGFLITSLLVIELQRSRGIRLGRFYGRRARRLLPAAVVCLVLICFLIADHQVPDRSGLRWYVFGALFQFANWVPLALHDSYSELFQLLSPTDHFWSLAIEEQFYWMWPLTMLLLYRAVGGRRLSVDDWMRRIAIGLAGLFVVLSVSAPVTAALWSSDAAYYATWARIPEILAGALLAVLVLRGGTHEWVKWLAPTCLIAIIAISMTTPAGRGFAYHGGLPLFALVSAGLIAGLQQPSPLRSLLSTKPFVGLGKISYGVYLYHWPVFVVLTQGRTELDVLPLSLLRVGVTFSIAIASYFLVEQPIRERRFLHQPRLGFGVTAMAIPAVALLGLTQVSNTSSFERATDTLPTVVGTVAPLVAQATTTTTTPAAATSRPAAASSAVTTQPATTTTEAPITTARLVPTRPVRIMVVGDSTAQVTGHGMIDWAADNPALAQVEVQAFGGCGILEEGDRSYRGEWEPTLSTCVTLIDHVVPERIGIAQPDVVVVVSSFWDITDHRWPGDPTARSPLDPVYRERAVQRFTQYNQALLDAGAPRVAWILFPRTNESWDAIAETSDDPARHVAFHEIERDAAAKFPGRVSTIDLSSWSDQQGLTDDHAARPDGVHWTPDMSKLIAEEWLGNQVIQAALH